MNMRKRIERLEAQRPRDDTRLDALLWRVLATLGVDELEQRVLLDHADAVEAGLACGEPPEIVGAWRGIRPAGLPPWGSGTTLGRAAATDVGSPQPGRT